MVMTEEACVSDDDLLPSWINGDRNAPRPGRRDDDPPESDVDLDTDPTEAEAWTDPARDPGADRADLGGDLGPDDDGGWAAPGGDLDLRPDDDQARPDPRDDGAARHASRGVADRDDNLVTGAAADDRPVDAADGRPVDDGDDPAFEVEHSELEWVAVAPRSGETFPLGEPAWPQVPEVDHSPVTTAEMTGLWLSPETGRESPLRIDGEPIDPRDAGVTDELALRLLDLSDMWQRDWDPITGWRPRARPDDFDALAHHLARRLKDAAGATDVTLYLAQYGHAGVFPIAAATEREPVVVRLMNDYGARMPVWGSFVTESGVGAFTSELNLKLEAWAEVFAENMDPEHGWRRPEITRAYRTQALALADEMRDELGPDYVVDVDLWEIDDV